jgi:hypothetical protein
MLHPFGPVQPFNLRADAAEVRSGHEQGALVRLQHGQLAGQVGGMILAWLEGKP